MKLAVRLKRLFHGLNRKVRGTHSLGVLANGDRPAGQKPVDLDLTDEAQRWLDANRIERMDAMVSIFDEKRREFHLDRYRFAAKRVKEKEVLDCACGTGYGVRLLREAGKAASVIGIDIDKHAVRYADKKHRIEPAAS